VIRKPRLPLVALLTLLLLAAGCAAQPASGSTAAGIRYEWGGRLETLVDNSEGQLQDEIAAAVNVVDQFWTDHWSDYFSSEYEPPTIVGGYEGSNGPSCDGEPSEPMNAYYCASEDYIAWDMELMRTYYEDGQNDVFPYMVIAHEWGHAIEHRVDPSDSAPAPELQADCLAGLAVYGAVNDGTLTLESGDGNEIAKTFSVLGDDTPWADPATHGDAVERTAAFAAGRSGDIDNCIRDRS
jgi:uncharacterized protein